MPILPLREIVTYPGTLTPLAVGQERSIRLIDEVLGGDRALAMVTSREPELDEPGPEQLYGVGVAGVVARMMKVPDETIRILVQGTQRVEIGEYLATEPYLIARVRELPDELDEGKELEALTRNVQTTFSEIIEEIPYLPEELQLAVTNVEDPSALSHLIAGALRISTGEKQEILEQVNVVARLRRLAEILARELEVIQIGTKIHSQVQEGIDKGQREYYLREQLKAIQEELGEGGEQAEVNELRERIEADAASRARSEGRRSRARPPRAAAPGRGRVRRDPDLSRVADRAALERDHRGQAQHQARPQGPRRRSLRPRAGQGPDPRVPRRAQAEAGLERPDPLLRRAAGRRQDEPRTLDRRAPWAARFERISVGGVRDEAEIRGHRRTYIGAMPGTIIRALRDAGTRNPLFMIDEIDKMGADFRGDPSSAMLEVLDPSQNDSFRDHYLDLDFDLSDVMFIATANLLDPIPAPLRDRMEVIHLSGYTLDEKLHIAKRYLVPRQVAENGLTPSQVAFSDAALKAIAEEYTREAGVRNLERQIGTVCRKLARDRAEGRVKQEGHRLRQAGAGAARATAVLLGGEAADAPAGGGDGPRLDAGRWRGPVHRGDRDARQRAS